MRDKLALERTRLANERTMLAYVRTALSLLAAGALLIHFFPGDMVLQVIAWVMVASGGSTLAFGCARFIRVRRELRGEQE